jgi:hypothetical protein
LKNFRNFLDGNFYQKIFIEKIKIKKKIFFIYKKIKKKKKKSILEIFPNIDFSFLLFLKKKDFFKKWINFLKVNERAKPICVKKAHI